MASITFLRPIDQFDGTMRLLPELEKCLDAVDLSSFKLAVAYAKVAPLAKLLPSLEAWNQAGKKSEAIIGLNHKGTSLQALELALKVFDETYVCYPGPISTFHPKFYLFHGAASATVFFGSHNLTVGGTETNLEGGIRLELTVPPDADLLDQALSCWSSLLPQHCAFTKKLNSGLLKQLVAAGLLFDESIPAERFSPKAKTTGAMSTPALFPIAYPKPPQAIPKKVLGAKPPKATSGSGTGSTKKGKSKSVAGSVSAGETLVIQIVPHHNGEVFLSKIAINQNPGFFKFPFTGKTTPKKSTNTAYPQRDPDPVVDVVVFDDKGKVLLQKTGFPLNTVFYDLKGEIRITISPDLLKATKPFSILQVRTGDASRDYYLDIFNPGSTQYTALLAACNQTLPSGGAAQSRKMGWL